MLAGPGTQGTPNHTFWSPNGSPSKRFGHLWQQIAQSFGADLARGAERVKIKVLQSFDLCFLVFLLIPVFWNLSNRELWIFGFVDFWNSRVVFFGVWDFGDLGTVVFFCYFGIFGTLDFGNLGILGPGFTVNPQP